MKPVSKYFAAASLFAVSLAFSTVANADAIADRKAKMKAVGKNLGVIAKMVKGETEFNGEAALAAYVGMGEAGTGFLDLFPEGTETGGETTASPKIWEDRAGYEAAGKAFVDDLTVAINAGAPSDIDALKATFGPVAQNCSECHKTYRIKKN